MGEAKRRAARRKVWDTSSRPMKRARFDLYTLGTRLSWARVLAEELSFWSDYEERILGLVFRDTQDDDYGWAIMARDKIGRFRWVDGNTSLRSEFVAVEGVRERITKVVDEGNFLALADQGDETNYPTDVL